MIMVFVADSDLRILFPDEQKKLRVPDSSKRNDQRFRLGLNAHSKKGVYQFLGAVDVSLNVRAIKPTKFRGKR